MECVHNRSLSQNLKKYFTKKIFKKRQNNYLYQHLTSFLLFFSSFSHDLDTPHTSLFSTLSPVKLCLMEINFSPLQSLFIPLCLSIAEVTFLLVPERCWHLNAYNDFYKYAHILVHGYTSLCVNVYVRMCIPKTLF